MDIQDELNLVKSVLTYQNEVLEQLVRLFPESKDKHEEKPDHEEAEKNPKPSAEKGKSAEKGWSGEKGKSAEKEKKSVHFADECPRVSPDMT